MPTATSSFNGSNSAAAAASSGQPHIRATKKTKRSHPASSSSAFASTSSLSLSHPHPLNIKPAGNALLASGPPSRYLTLGSLAILSDDLITHVITAYSNILTPSDLCALSAVSSAWRAFANQEGVWRNTFIERHGGIMKPEIGWRGSWKMTCLAHLAEQQGKAFPPSSRLASIRPSNPFYSDSLYLPHRLSLLPLSKYLPTGSAGSNPSTAIPRIPASSSLADFHARYPALNKPVIIEAPEESSIAGLGTSTEGLKDKYSSRWVRAEAIRTTVSVYAQYSHCCEKQQSAIARADGDEDVARVAEVRYDPMTVPDESPFYLFDSEIPSQMAADGLWTVPQQILQCPSSPYQIQRSSPESAQRQQVEADLFSLLSSSRPDYRWLIAGPTRSGSGWHKDPNYTSAWNTPLSGRKLWLMLPPHVAPPGVYVSEDGAEVTAPVSLIEWLDDFYVETKRLHGPPSSSSSARGGIGGGGDGQLLEGICGPGETVYVPSGWWHLVVNLEESVALTQNFVSLAELPEVLFFMKHKPEQVSGFKFSKTSSEGREEGSQQQQVGQEEEDQEEDEDEVEGDADPRRGLYDVFLGKLKVYDEELATWALQKLAVIEEREKATLEAARREREAGAADGSIKRKRKTDEEEGGLTWWDKLKAGEGNAGAEAGEQDKTAGGATFAMGLAEDELEDVPW
ncbi:Clavaminate synthase-like protein [Microstroma glucosiphilum]|uniref:Clavaminate synthase-like protein n=1 Tax=Pseudomicrostroma glucosiphilum TaxID=1684307 RepID=A0A316U2E4_9BASI|nr:Clavaminate synthase-like protein [Pseudomicrostroma glucosiphilum]PWN19516.1 Clavaminate synthase-like protein [Pseudomicrostroma glucosiphilum]